VPLSPLPYRSQLDVVDGSLEVFVHVPLRTITLEQKSSRIEPLY
jgi:hypothetical protein